SVGCLPCARIKDLYVSRVGSRVDPFSFAIKDDYHTHARPILIISQAFCQRFTGQRGPPRLELAQFRPGKTNAVPIDNQIAGPVRHCYDRKRNPIKLRLFRLPAFASKSRLRFCVIGLKKPHSSHSPMTHRESALSAVTPKGVAGFAILLLVLAAFFGLLNSQKMKTLRATVATAQTARDAAERGIHEKLNPQAGGAVEDQGKVAQAENRAAKAEAELAQIQKEKADLQTKLAQTQKQIPSK